MSVDEAPQGHTPADLAGLLINEPKAPVAAGKEAVDHDDVDVDALLAADERDTDDEDGLPVHREQSAPDDPDAPTDDGEAGEGDDDNGDPTEPHYTVKVDGKPVRVSLKEALEGYARTQDYTRKTQELADHRKVVDQEIAAARGEREQYAAVLTTLKERLGDEAGEPTQAQWDKLAADYPERYATEYANYQRRKEARAAVTAEQDRLANERGVENTKAFHDFLGKQREALLEKLPAWKDPEKYKTGSKAVFDFAKDTYGFSAQELDRAYDHRVIAMAEDARKWHAVVAKQKAAKGKLDAAPSAPPPRARQAPVPRRQAERVEAEKRFNKTGRVEDALPLMFAR